MVFSNFPDLFQAMVSGNDLCHFVLNRGPQAFQGDMAVEGLPTGLPEFRSMRVLLPTSLSTPKLRRAVLDCGAKLTIAGFLDWMWNHFSGIVAVVTPVVLSIAVVLLNQWCNLSEEHGQHRGPVRPVEAQPHCFILGFFKGVHLGLKQATCSDDMMYPKLKVSMECSLEFPDCMPHQHIKVCGVAQIFPQQGCQWCDDSLQVP